MKTNREYAYFYAPRCGAKTRSGQACKSPAVKGRKRCRMHGGAQGSGAPKNNHNALKHGFTTKQAINNRKHINSFMKICHELINDLT